MRLVYMGTPRFAVAPLRAIAAAGHEIVGVVTRPDKPAGRGRTLAAPPVKEAAQDLGLSVYQPKLVRAAEFIEVLRKIGPDAIVVAAYGQILSREVLELPKYGCINIHASLLPLYRGAAPINWAIMSGERATGNTIMLMDEGMDTGAVLMQESVPIGPEETAGALTERLSALGAKQITTALPLIASGALIPVTQENAKATLAPLLKKRDGLLDWNHSASELHNLVRGLSPWPGAYSFLDKKMVKLIATEAQDGSGEPGTIYEKDKSVLVAGTGSGLLRITNLQPEGGKVMTAAEFLRGHRGLSWKKFSAQMT